MENRQKVEPTDKNFNLGYLKHDFLSRWGVEIEENSAEAFKNRVLGIIQEICPKNTDLIKFEADLFYEIGLPYSGPINVLRYKLKDSVLIRLFEDLELKNDADFAKMFWYLEVMMNMDSDLIDSELFAMSIAESLEASRINSELCIDGSFYKFYPLDIDALDNRIVEVFQWLSEYPEAKEAFKEALVLFQSTEDLTVFIVQLVKSLELFYQSFLSNSDSLDNQKQHIDDYLLHVNSSKEIKEIHHILINLLVKNSLSSKYEAEFLIHLTGASIRFMIQSKDI